MKIFSISFKVLGLILSFLGGAGTALWLTDQFDADVVKQMISARGEAAVGAREQRAERLIDQQYLYDLLLLVDHNSRRQLLDNEVAFKDFVVQEKLNLSVLEAATANGTDAAVAVQSLIKRAQQTVIIEAYLNDIVARNLDENFPTSTDITQFYQDNPDKFRLPDRIHLWQIFIPLQSVEDLAAITNAKALATQIAADINKATISFAEAVKKYSQHLPSRLNDGYMGLIKTTELLPPIKATALRLERDTVSQPVQTDAGFHLIKRGEIVPGEMLSLDVAAGQIANQLREAAVRRVREAAAKKIAENYPVTLDESQVPIWREALRQRSWESSLSTSPGFKRSIGVN